MEFNPENKKQVIVCTSMYIFTHHCFCIHAMIQSSLLLLAEDIVEEVAFVVLLLLSRTLLSLSRVKVIGIGGETIDSVERDVEDETEDAEDADEEERSIG